MISNTIVDKLARTIERNEFGKGGLHPLPFVYADIDMQNVAIDNIEPPFAAAAPLSSSIVASSHGNYREEATFEVFFGDVMRTPFADYNARENERIIDECKQRAFQWLAFLQQRQNELQLVNVNSMQRVVLQFDAICTGVIVSVTLLENEMYGLCDLGVIQ